MSIEMCDEAEMKMMIPHHEAAHAVALLALGFPFKEIRCQPEACSGSVDTGFEFGPDNLEAALVVYLAPLAREGYSHIRASVFGDYKDAEELCRKFRPEGDVEALMKQALVEANTIMTRNASGTLSLACELRRLGTLTYEDARRVAGL